MSWLWSAALAFYVHLQCAEGLLFCVSSAQFVADNRCTVGVGISNAYPHCLFRRPIDKALVLGLMWTTIRRFSTSILYSNPTLFRFARSQISDSCIVAS